MSAGAVRENHVSSRARRIWNGSGRRSSAFEQDVVETDVGGVAPGQRRRWRLAPQPLLQVVERCHDVVAHHQQLAVEDGGEGQRRGDFRETPRRRRRRCARRAARPAGTRCPASCTRMPSHFHSAAKSAATRFSSSPSSSGCASIIGRKTAASPAAGGGACPSSQANSGEIGWHQAVPDLLYLRHRNATPAAIAIFASRAETPTRRPPVASFSSAKRPDASSASSQPSSSAGASAHAPSPPGFPPRGRGWAPSATALRPTPARSAPPSRRGRRHSRRRGQTAADRPGFQPRLVSSPRGRAASTSSPVSAARPKPRSGSDVPAQQSPISRNLALRCGA